MTFDNSYDTNIHPRRTPTTRPILNSANTRPLLVVSCIILFVNQFYLVGCDDRPNEVLELTSSNYDTLTSKYQIVVLNFYADWCPYSAKWKPTFQDTAKMVYNETRELDPTTVVFGQINCVEQTTLSHRFRITKFPTTKITLNGKPIKKEYRGARTINAFKDYISKFLADPVLFVNTEHDLQQKVETRKGAFILYSGRTDEHGDKPAESVEVQLFRRIAQQFREDCQFIYAASGSHKSIVTDLYSLSFKPQHKSLDRDIKYTGHSLTDLSTLTNWVKDNCIPLVREITFENAEELTEEGLPFVILFYDPKDTAWIEVYKRVVENELKSDANSVTFLIADGHVFSHPLKHLGRTTKDLPVLAIDSFKHLFLYKYPLSTISQPGYLKQFILDLHSGKLDREFHFGPDPVTNAVSPPESAFNKLSPSASRYTFIRDEL